MGRMEPELYELYLCMFDSSVSRALERAYGSETFTDDDLSVYLDTDPKPLEPGLEAPA